MKKPRTLFILFTFFLVLIALALGISGCGKSVVARKKQPNIVLLVIDALRADKLGCYGFPGEISPEIDKMASEGTVFLNTFSQCSWTRPSIGSMITSLYPRKIGIYREKFDVLQDKFVTLAEVLKSNGYFTYGITANPNINKVFNFHQGFDEYEDSNAIWKWMKSEPGKQKTSSEIHLPQSQEIFSTIIKRVQRLKLKKPVFIQINIMEVHSPYLIRDEYKSAFPEYPVKPSNFKYPLKKLTKLVRGTLAAVQQVSFDVGQFVNNLSTIPGWENTLFVITSDHGQGLDNHPDVYNSHTHGNLLYESHLKVPLIFYQNQSSKNIKYSPHHVEERVCLLDIMPTILDYAGITTKTSKLFDGKSLIGLIKGEKLISQPADYFIAETNWRKVNKIALYSIKWKYIVNRDRWKGVNKKELQPLNFTENGRITDKIRDYPEIAKGLGKMLLRWEKKNKKVKPSLPQGRLTKKEIQQLKSLGYLN